MKMMKMDDVNVPAGRLLQLVILLNILILGCLPENYPCSQLANLDQNRETLSVFVDCIETSVAEDAAVASSVLGEFPGAEIDPIIEYLLEGPASKDYRLRILIAGIVGISEDPILFDYLSRLAEDDHPLVVSRALVEIGAFPVTVERKLKYFIPLPSSHYHRIGALRGLRHLADEPIVCDALIKEWPNVEKVHDGNNPILRKLLAGNLARAGSAAACQLIESYGETANEKGNHYLKTSRICWAVHMLKENQSIELSEFYPEDNEWVEVYLDVGENSHAADRRQRIAEVLSNAEVIKGVGALLAPRVRRFLAENGIGDVSAVVEDCMPLERPSCQPSTIRVISQTKGFGWHDVIMLAAQSRELAQRKAAFDVLSDLCPIPIPADPYAAPSERQNALDLWIDSCGVQKFRTEGQGLKTR